MQRLNDDFQVHFHHYTLSLDHFLEKEEEMKWKISSVKYLLVLIKN
jgi:hypothetical protein